jgi:cupin fold WbuC family metalloprotein
MSLRKINDELFVSEDPIVKVGRIELAILKAQARVTPRKRARICAHKSEDDPLHEMLIAMSVDSYIHPHMHLGKTESFHVVEGSVDIIIFDKYGDILDIIDLGEPASGQHFFYRLPEGIFHTLLIKSEYLVMHEVTNGPFARERTILANFAPKETDHLLATQYMKSIRNRVSQFFCSNA